MKKYRTIYFTRQDFDTTSVDTEATSVDEAVAKAEWELKKSYEENFEDEDQTPEELTKAVTSFIRECEFYHVATFELADGAECVEDFFEL